MLDALASKVIAAPTWGLAGIWFAATAPIVAVVRAFDQALPDPDSAWGHLVRQVPGQVGLIVVVGMGLKVALVVLKDWHTTIEDQGARYRAFSDDQTKRFEQAISEVRNSQDRAIEAIVANREALRELVESHRELAREVRELRIENGPGKGRISDG